MLAVPAVSAMGFGDEAPEGARPDPGSARGDEAGATRSLVTDAGRPQRAISSLSSGRELRNAAEEAAAQAAADALAAQAVEDAEPAPTTTTEAPTTTTPPTTAAPARVAVTAPPTTAPAPPPAPATATAPPVTSGVWDQIAACESGGNWSISTGNGYYGGLQFLLSTWQLHGGTQYAAYPHQATREQQIAVAESVVAASGGSYGAWGGCSAALGLP